MSVTFYIRKWRRCVWGCRRLNDSTGSGKCIGWWNRVWKQTLDLSTQVLSHKDNGNIELSLIEAKLLKELIVNVGHTVDASTIMQLIWQRDDPYSRNSLHGFIHKLRHYLRYDPSISLINQRGIGYMLTAKREWPIIVMIRTFPFQISSTR